MIINLLVGFFIGLSSGATVIISQFYGARQKAKVSQAVHTAVAFSIAGGLVIMAVGLISAPAALKAMGTPAETMDDSILYLRILFPRPDWKPSLQYGSWYFAGNRRLQTPALLFNRRMYDQHYFRHCAGALLQNGGCRSCMGNDSVPVGIGSSGNCNAYKNR